MKTLKFFLEASDYEYSGKKSFFAGDDPDDRPLPSFVISKIRSNIRRGAQDTSQQWANALELVHRAFTVTQNMAKEVSAKGKPSKFAEQIMRAGIKIERPTPEHSEAWKQYEELIQFAVQELAKVRGIKADWRMSSSIFRESRLPVKTFAITFGSDDQAVLTESASLSTLLQAITENVEDDIEVNVFHDDKKAVIEFWKDNVKLKNDMIIEQEGDIK